MLSEKVSGFTINYLQIQSINLGTARDELNIDSGKTSRIIVDKKGVVFHQDNARPHVSLTTREKLLKLGCTASYSIDIVSSDFHSFKFLQNSLSGKNFNSLVDIKNHFEKFFTEKTEKFWKNKIFKLHERWKKVVKQNGE